MEVLQEMNELTRTVIGAAIEVHRCLGPGYREAVYEDAMAIELRSRGIPFRKQAPVEISYKGESVGTGFVDFLVDDELVVELKAVESLLPVHKSQVVSYLRATECRVALLINFNVRILSDGVKRIALTQQNT